MKNKLLYTGIGLLIAGTIGRLYAAQVSYVDADGFLHDSIWLLFGSIFWLLGLMLLLVFAIQQLVRIVKNRR